MLKNRMNQESLNALSSGSCTIILDACMVLRVNGKNKGGMNDNGLSWGKVYTTYAGISKAAKLDGQRTLSIVFVLWQDGERTVSYN